MSNIVIGIEGLVGSGKTTICRKLLDYVPNSVILHGGNLYRGIVYALINENKNLSNNLSSLKDNLKDIDITDLMRKLKVEIKLEDKETVVYINGKKIEEEELQSDKSSMAVSVAGNAADNSNLFVFARNIINNFKEKYNVIVSGRALMQIYPDLDYHFFITASLEERVNRKLKQYDNSMDREELKIHILKRDELQEKSGFYKKYEKTIEVDVTDCKTAEESTKEVCKYIKETYALI